MSITAQYAPERTVFILTYSCISVVRLKSCVTFFGTSGCGLNFSKIFWLRLWCDLDLILVCLGL